MPCTNVFGCSAWLFYYLIEVSEEGLRECFSKFEG
jgi:hypothetical protein